MRTENAASDSIVLAYNRSARFLGHARVALDKLSFDKSMRTGHREVPEKVTNQLISVFKLEGCRRFDEETFIDVLIDQKLFESILLSTEFTLSSFREETRKCAAREIPFLDLSQKVDCLNGLRRTRAAQKFLDPNDQWWVVKLYSEDFSFDARESLVQSYQHEHKFSDGIIFRNIRKAKRDGRIDDENLWWARLTDGKRRDLRQLIKNKTLITGFDNLLQYPGLWDPVQLGTLHRLHGLRCEEELANYLAHIKDVWSFIVGDGSCHHVDTSTVQSLELRAPGVSKCDAHNIMHDSKIFSSVNHQQRSLYLSRVSLIKRIIPSLRVFFENQKYLEPCSLVLRSLLSANEKRSLWKAFSANYFTPQQFEVQTSEYEHTIVNTTILNMPRDEQQQYQKQIGYLQLWLFCLRNFPEMTSITPRIGISGKKVRSKRNEALWQRLGFLACKYGFRTERAEQLAAANPDKEHIDQFLSAARSGCDRHNEYDNIVSKIMALIETIPVSPRESSEILVGSNFCDFAFRDGRPHQDDHEADKNSLFLRLFSIDTQSMGAHTEFTTLYVKRDLLEAFFFSTSFRVQLPDATWTLPRIPIGSSTPWSRNFSELQSQLLEVQNDMEEQRQRFLLEKRQWDSRIEGLLEENRQWERSNRELTDERTRRTLQVQEENEKTQRLYERIKILEKECSDQEQELQEYRDDNMFGDRSNENVGASTELQELRQQLDVANFEHGKSWEQQESMRLELEARVQESHRSIESLREENVTMKVKLQKLSEQNGTHVADNQTLVDKLKSYKALEIELHEEKSRNASTDEAQQRFVLEKKSHSFTTEQLVHERAHAETMKKQIEKLEEDIVSFQQQLRDKDAEKKQIEESSVSLEEDIALLRKQLQDSEGKRPTSNHEKEEQLLSLNNQLDQQRQAYKAISSDLEQEKSQYETTKGQLASERHAHSQSLEMHADEIASRDRKIENLEGQLGTEKQLLVRVNERLASVLEEQSQEFLRLKQAETKLKDSSARHRNYVRYMRHRELLWHVDDDYWLKRETNTDAADEALAESTRSIMNQGVSLTRTFDIRDFEMQVETEKEQDVVHLINVDPYPGDHIMIIYVRKIEGFRSAKYFIPSSTSIPLRNFINALPSSITFCIVQRKGNEYIPLVFPFSDATQLIDTCKRQGVCYVGEKNDIDALMGVLHGLNSGGLRGSKRPGESGNQKLSKFREKY
ncbi:unnamed protein product [Periconia digitata]|uniref:Uncharacterized protein n=1 Tax=Periconia digitata TaxID=1303443 RepID=A0A9W4ULY4_9PLEO|nr:unnamed protein product [Periconia digitata]